MSFTDELFEEAKEAIRGKRENILRYGEFLVAIEEDLSLATGTFNPGVTTADAFIKEAIRVLPMESEEYQKCVKYAQLNVMERKKNEYIRCVKRGSKDKSYEWKLRSDLEYNASYVQTVSFIIPCMYYKSIPFFIFLEESGSDMSGHTTFIGGHIAYDYRYTLPGFRNEEEIFYDSAVREVHEEINLSKYCFKKDDDVSPIYFPHNNDPSSITYYHEGAGYVVQMCDRDGAFHNNPRFLEIMKETLDVEAPTKKIVLWTDGSHRENITDDDVREFARELGSYKMGDYQLFIGEEMLNRTDYPPDTWVEEFCKRSMNSRLRW